MMAENTKRVLIATLIALILAALIAVSMTMDVNLMVLKLTSIKSLLAKRSDLIATQAKLEEAEKVYDTAIAENSTEQTNFTSEKKKYEAISDETIKTVKEATTQDNYSIEYMWIRLGNYATANNLTIAIADPGSSIPTQNVNVDENMPTQETITTSSDSAPAEGEATDTQVDTQTDVETLFAISVSGSYLNVADFVFDVENDDELRFKLDNISMDYLSGTTITARFNVKDLIIKK